MEEKTCALYDCEKPVTNWRWSCCCLSHQRKFSGLAGRKPWTAEDKILYHRVYSTEKQKRIKMATPGWANKEAIKNLYKEAIQLTLSTGIKHEVDHIVPLTNNIVCGLHVEHNLQVISLEDNRTKYNKFIQE